MKADAYLVRLVCAWDRRHARYRMLLPGAGRPAAVSPHQASLIVDTVLALDDGLNMPAEEPFQFWERSGEKSLILLC